MRLYNTLSGKVEEFTSPNGQVGMYVCGITPYSASHIGHAMMSVVFDVVRRYLEFNGFKVRHIQNFTDVDDKMIAAANELGISVSELAERYIDDYLREMDALNVTRAHAYPRATGEMDKIRDMIGRLLDKGYAYAVDGDVYFRVRRDDDYGKLSGRDLDSLKAGARVEVEDRKEDVMDFALWKGQKPGEPAWDSPWGPGRPGWHIECSAMAIKYLGETIDMHGGGQDLLFPHHENEIAQSEAYSDRSPFARFWVHSGTLRLGQDKMSKSLGNVITVSEALERFSPDALRMFFLSSHYRSPLAYGEQSVVGQERALERLRNALRNGDSSDPGESLDPAPARARFIAAMDDDLNTPQALAALFDLAREINRGKTARIDVSAAQDTLKQLTELLGLTMHQERPSIEADVAAFVQLLVDTRSELRAAGQYALSDSIRDRLAGLGISLEDSADGTEWRAD